FTTRQWPSVPPLATPATFIQSKGEYGLLARSRLRLRSHVFCRSFTPYIQFKVYQRGMHTQSALKNGGRICCKEKTMTKRFAMAAILSTVALNAAHAVTASVNFNGAVLSTCLSA